MRETIEGDYEMNKKYLKALNRAMFYNSIFSIMGVIGLFVFCMLPVLFISIELIGMYSVFLVILMILIIVFGIKWYINRINKMPDYLDKLILKINVDVKEMEIDNYASGTIYYFKGTHTFSYDTEDVDTDNQLFETIEYKCYFDDGCNVMIDYMRRIKEKNVFPQLEVNINPSNHHQYYIDSEEYMRKLECVLTG